MEKDETIKPPEWANKNDVVCRIILFHNGQTRIADMLIAEEKLLKDILPQKARNIILDKVNQLAVSIRISIYQQLGLDVV